MTNQTEEAVKGKIICQLLKEEAIGESQCPLERIIQCINVPTHMRGEAKNMASDMVKDRDIPVFSKGGSSRSVYHINPSKVEQAKELANKWHPDREEGQTFDRTDISSKEEKQELIFSVSYDNQNNVWDVLENADSQYDYVHGGETNKVSSDRIIFQIKDYSDELVELKETLTNRTSGQVEYHKVPEQVQKKKLKQKH